MTKLTLGSHPHMLGFEQLERLLERTAKTGNEGYPPFNIEQTSDRGYRISIEELRGVARDRIVEHAQVRRKSGNYNGGHALAS